MKLPVRKCYHAAKVGFLVILVVTILAIFEQWRGGKRSARAQTSDLEDVYEREILEDEARIIPGLGEGGVAAHLAGEAKRLGEESEKKLAINVYLSDRIAYNRSLKDHRNPACSRVVYDAELPSASVILIFHNEPYSVVVRTIWSVINSARRDQPWYRKANYVDRETGRTMTLGYPGQDPASPFVYLKEIILVDDNSTLPELKGKLSHYVRTRLPPDLIRILRLPDRQGLMLARLAGARLARGDVLVFLDAHCEAGADWLRPLLQRVQHKRDAVLTPLIDVLDQTTFQLDAAQHFQVGGFTFMGHFTWIDVPEREKKRRGSDIAPTWSPTMAGGLFAINRAYYWEIGAYDEQMAGWGGENLEMSFRVWQCGGTLETIPCSRVGHVFRSFHPYGLPAHSDTHGINTARMAEVWMDDYAELFYLHRPDLRKNPKIGDVTHRRILREKLKCKSFQWYLDNVYKEKFVPVRDVYGFGRFMNPASGLCLDTLQREGEAAPLGVYGCHARLEATQYLALSLRGELRDEEKCAEVQYKRSAAGEDLSRRVLMVTCHGKQRGQKWRYLPTEQLQHAESRLCLTATGASGSDATVAKCRDSPRQVWKIDYSELNDFGMNNAIEPSEQELRLQRLRGNRRISRSLLSYTDEDGNKTRRHHHKNKNSKTSKNKKHKHKKDKFILKLIRTNANNTEEHLEVDVYCRHKQLYPNNSFVRDLVTVLNDKDIKVINNGRVFEHNRVFELAKRERVQPGGTLAGMSSPPPHQPHIEPIEPKTQKKRKPKKTSQLQPLNVLSAVDSIDKIARIDENDAIDRQDAMDPTEEPMEKKIIIEDFVEVKPSTIATQRSPKKRKRIRPRVPARPTEPPAHYSEAGPEWQDSMKMERVSSLEDAPLMSGERRADHSGDSRPVGESRLRSNSTRALARARTRTRAPRHRSAVPVFSRPQEVDNELADEASAEEADRTPVKVVMRSNLTFNLGDEFFRWRQRTADDVANLLGELVIPANTPTHKHTSVETDDANTHTHDTHNTQDLTHADTDTDDETHTQYSTDNDIEKELHRQQSKKEFRNKEKSGKELREESGKDELLTGKGRSRIVTEESSSSESEGEE